MPASRASATLGSHPRPSTTRSAGSVPSPVHDRRDAPVGVGLERRRRACSVCSSMPRPRIASATSAPMSGSSVSIGCSPASTIVHPQPAPVQRLGQLEPDVAARRRRPHAVASPVASTSSRSAMPSPSVWTPWIPARVDAGQRRAGPASRRSRSRAGRTARRVSVAGVEIAHA